MADSAQDRRLPATSKKIATARKDGQVARSRDLGHLATLGMGGVLLVAMAPTLTGWLLHLMAAGLRFDATQLAHPDAMVERLGSASWTLLVIVLPMGLAMGVLAIAVATLAGGWNFTLKPMRPRFGKFNPIAGFGRMLSSQQLIDVLKACGLALILGTIAALYLRAHVNDFTQLLGMPLLVAVRAAGEIVIGGLLLLLLTLGIFALIDVPLQRHLLAERLKMSHQEVKTEHKQSEGNPEVKGRIRARMRQLAQRRMLAAVPQADIVVMNPTHYAVALKYDDASMAAPRVVAKGADLLALRIRDSARAANVPVLEAPPLARALFAHCEVDREIPAALFGAVAQVLAWVYQLRAAANRAGSVPVALPTLHVPAELDPVNKIRRQGAEP
jgi:flagellar biosynthesis protein FlhB